MEGGSGSASAATSGFAGSAASTMGCCDLAASASRGGSSRFTPSPEGSPAWAAGAWASALATWSGDGAAEWPSGALPRLGLEGAGSAAPSGGTVGLRGVSGSVPVWSGSADAAGSADGGTGSVRGRSLCPWLSLAVEAAGAAADTSLPAIPEFGLRLAGPGTLVSANKSAAAPSKMAPAPSTKRDCLDRSRSDTEARVRVAGCAD